MHGHQKRNMRKANAFAGPYDWNPYEPTKNWEESTRVTYQLLGSWGTRDTARIEYEASWKTTKPDEPLAG